MRELHECAVHQTLRSSMKIDVLDMRILNPRLSLSLCDLSQHSPIPYIHWHDSRIFISDCVRDESRVRSRYCSFVFRSRIFVSVFPIPTVNAEACTVSPGKGSSRFKAECSSMTSSQLTLVLKSLAGVRMLKSEMIHQCMCRRLPRPCSMAYGMKTIP